MKSIRIGKDIKVRWPILTNGQEIALEGRDLTLYARLPTYAKVRIDFTTEANVATFIIPGVEQKMTGVYSFTMWENYGKEAQTAVDCCNAFHLVETTCMEGGEDKGLNIETIELASSDIIIGVPGPKGGTPKITADEKGNIYSDGEFVTGVVAEAVEKVFEAAAAAAPVVVNVEGPEVTIDVKANHKYICGELKSLTISSVEQSALESTIWFRSGATKTQLTMPDELNEKVIGYSVPAANTDYEINIANGILIIANTH